MPLRGVVIFCEYPNPHNLEGSEAVAPPLTGCKVQTYTMSSFPLGVFGFVVLGFVQNHRLESGMKQQSLILSQRSFSDHIKLENVCAFVANEQCRMA